MSCDCSLSTVDLHPLLFYAIIGMGDDEMDHSTLKNMLKNNDFAREIAYFQEIDSTNTQAKRLAAEGAVHGTLIIADSQTAGRGRMGKQFFSPQGTGLYMSLILRSRIPAGDMLAVTACTAAAVHTALQQFGITAQIKWVNDLFLNGRKICGILTEGCFRADGTLDHLVIGIGLNVRKNPCIPPDLQDILTDLETETGQQFSRTALCAAIVQALSELLASLSERTFLDIYTTHSCTLGHRVMLIDSGTVREALAMGYAQDAGLVVRYDDGTEEIIRSGQAKVID